MKVHIDKEEWFPVYAIDTHADRHGCMGDYEVPVELVEAYDNCYELFVELQKKIKKYYDKGSGNA